MKIDVVKIQQIKEGELDIYTDMIRSSKDAYSIISEYLQGADREYLVVLSLNSKNIVNNITTVSIGSLSSSIVHPREVFKTLVMSNAASFVIGHNHPSGDPTPSREDIQVTNRVDGAGKILGIELLDHIIIGDNKYISFKEEGFI